MAHTWCAYIYMACSILVQWSPSVLLCPNIPLPLYVLFRMSLIHQLKSKLEYLMARRGGRTFKNLARYIVWPLFHHRKKCAAFVDTVRCSCQACVVHFVYYRVSWIHMFLKVGKMELVVIFEWNVMSGISSDSWKISNTRLQRYDVMLDKPRRVTAI